MRLRWFWFACLAFFLASPSWAALPRCLFVSSYHQGYAWSDGVQRGIEAVLKGRCELRQFDMDTKRHKTQADKEAAARRARALIEQWHPQVVIAADDNAARYLIAPYFRDAAIPFVFCGVNWSVAEYGFPYRNVTGMIEVAPVRPMIREAQMLTGNGDRFFYLGADTATEHKNLARFRKVAEALHLSVEYHLVSSLDEWVMAYRQAQDHPYLVIGSHAGITDWDFAAAKQAIVGHTRRLSVTSHEWMMPVSMLGFTKIPEEQGHWAAEAALAILDGLKPSEIPIIANQRWDLWMNMSLLREAGIELPARLRSKAKRFETPQ
jgi:ABC-type uncharacterized transport system substrate-binding protein